MARPQPPAPAITGDVYRFSYQVLTEANTVAIIDIDYMGTAFAGDPATPMSGLLAAILAAANAAMENCLPALSVLRSASLACLSSLLPATLNTTIQSTGFVLSDQLPDENTVIVNKASTLKSMHGRGSFRMMTVPISFVTPALDPNRINAAAVTAYTALGTAFATIFSVAGINYNACISTRPTPPARVVSRAQFVLAFRVNRLIGTMRRRRVGRGI
jgi:hypothetical protein